MGSVETCVWECSKECKLTTLHVNLHISQPHRTYLQIFYWRIEHILTITSKRNHKTPSTHQKLLAWCYTNLTWNQIKILSVFCILDSIREITSWVVQTWPFIPTKGVTQSNSLYVLLKAFIQLHCYELWLSHTMNSIL